MSRIASGDWEDSRGEFFQEIYPSDRSSISDSIRRGGGRTSLPSTTSRSRGRTVTESTSGTTGRNPTDHVRNTTQPSYSNQQLTSASTRMSSNERVSTLESRRSTGGTTVPMASTTTIDEVAETTSYTNLQEAANMQSISNHTTSHAEQAPLSQPNTALEPVAETSTRVNLDNHINNAIRMNNIMNMTNRGRATKPRMRAAVQGLEADDSDQDMEVVDFTDENLATEIEVWKDMKRIKHLPAPLSQKKAMRLQYQKCPKIKLARTVAIRFGCQRGFEALKDLARSFSRLFHRICRPMVSIDKHRGGEMFTTMALHKLITLLCAVVSFNVLCFLIIPYLVFVCNLVDVDYSVASCHYLLNGTRRETDFFTSAFETLDVYDSKPPVPRYYQLPLLYGSFEQVSEKMDQSSIFGDRNGPEERMIRTRSSAYDQTSTYIVIQHVYEKHIPLIYICVIIVSEIGVAIYFFRQLLSLIKGVVYDQTADTWFKNLFASWNYSVVCVTSKILKHQSIYGHIKQKIRFSKYDAKKSCVAYSLFGGARLFGALITMILLGMIVFSMHFVSMLTPKKMVRSLTEQGYINIDGIQKIKTDWQIFFAFLPAVLVTFVKYITPPIARLLGKMENYKFTLRVSIYTARLFLNRTAALFTLVTTLFHVRLTKDDQIPIIINTANDIANQNEVNQRDFSSTSMIQNTIVRERVLLRETDEEECWEDKLCLQLVFLVLFDFMGDVILILFIRFPWVVFQGIVKQSWNCTVKLNYDPYETVIDLIWDLSIMMLGMLYCPILPVIICVKLVIVYGLKVFHIWVNCSASPDIHSASYIRFLFMGFSSISILFSTIASIFAITSIGVSSNCGPFKISQEKIIDIFSNELQEIPLYIKSNVSTPTLAYLLVCSIFVLLFGLYISHLKRLSIEKTANELKCQLAITTQEKCYLISKIKRMPSQNNRSGASSSAGAIRSIRASSRQNSVMHD